MERSIFYLIIFSFFYEICSIITNPTLIIPGLGELQGISGDGYDAYLSIPYAEPPINDLRWMPTVSPMNWTGLYNSTKFPSACPQRTDSIDFIQNITFSEDCLFLSIWKPQTIPINGSAVVVWLHDEGLLRGGAGDSSHNGQYMAQNQSIIFVLVQYRLGLLGFAALPELKIDNQYHTTGTYGILDQIAALKWVKQHIAIFGGDPNRITLGGFSGGATSVCMLTLSPLAQGLFNQIIMHSSNCWKTSKTVTETYSKTRNLIQSFCDLNAGTKTLLKCMRQLDANIIANVSMTMEYVLIDGYVINQHTFLSSQSFSSNNNQISAVLMGNTLNEGTKWVPDSVPNTSYSSFVSQYTTWIPLNSSSFTNVLSQYPCNESECKG